MIDLTPLDIRKKRGDFRRSLRGYEPQEVDAFLDLVAERLEALVRENLQFRERVHALHQQTEAQSQREEAVRDALVTAQELRTEIREQARVEADRIIREAQTEGRRLLAEAEAEVRTRLRNSERQADHAVATLGVLERRRLRFLQTFRQLLERELDVVEVEERRPPLEERSFDLEFGAETDQEALGAPDTAPSGDAAGAPGPEARPGGTEPWDAAPFASAASAPESGGSESEQGGPGATAPGLAAPDAAGSPGADHFAPEAAGTAPPLAEPARGVGSGAADDPETTRIHDPTWTGGYDTALNEVTWETLEEDEALDPLLDADVHDLDGRRSRDDHAPGDVSPPPSTGRGGAGPEPRAGEGILLYLHPEDEEERS